jgi:hypothetical protein
MDLKVDATLDETNSDLKAIHDEFTNAQSTTDDNSGIWGQSDVRDAMNDFVHGWYVHRDKINGRLGKLSDRVDQACNAWTDAEKQLTDSLATDSSTTNG